MLNKWDVCCFQLYIPSGYAPYIWEDLLNVGRPMGLVPAGLGARDTLRLEMGYRLYGNDMDETTTPLEAGLGWVVRFKKGDFIGKEALLKQKEEGLQRKLVGIEMDDRLIPRHGYPVECSAGEGLVTSGGFGYSVGRPIGLAYVPASCTQEGTSVRVLAGRRQGQGHVAALPFYKASPLVKTK